MHFHTIDIGILIRYIASLRVIRRKVMYEYFEFLKVQDKQRAVA